MNGCSAGFPWQNIFISRALNCFGGFDRYSQRLFKILASKNQRDRVVFAQGDEH